MNTGEESPRVHRNATTDPTPREAAAGRVATGLLAAQAVALAGIAVFYLYELVIGKSTDPMIVIMSVATMVVFVLGLAYTSKGLAQRHPRAQAPAIAANFLLVPLGIAMFRFAPDVFAGAVLVTGVVTIAAVLLMGRLGDD